MSAKGMQVEPGLWEKHKRDLAVKNMNEVISNLEYYVLAKVGDLKRYGQWFERAVNGEDTTMAPSEIASSMINDVAWWLGNMRIDLIVKYGAEGDAARRGETK